MGVKASPRPNGVTIDSCDAPTLQNGETSAVDATAPLKVLEKQPSSRRKGMEKSVLDDIMGDPDDFQDLADADMPSESDGGRWEDAVRAALEDEAAAGEVQQETNEHEESSPVGASSSKSLNRPTEEAAPDPSRGPSSSNGGGSTPDARIVEENPTAKGNDSVVKAKCGTTDGASKQWKTYQNRYFIIKSLNHHNIAKSIEKGIWATQAMNEPVLNEAFETSERVTLVFSVNMSSHFQGYARMTSPIGQRRANIWSKANEGANPWGGTFRVEWLRLYDLPFQKTVHLKNPLNAFKPVKISRDCQELTQAIGEALCALIDEGADREGRPKRKPVPGVAVPQIGKRPREVAGEVPHRLRMSSASPVGHVVPQIYPPHKAPSETFPSRPIVRPSTGFTSKSLHMSETPRLSKSRSPHPATSEKSERERVRDRDRGLEKDRTRSSSSSRSADLAPEEDLLNMTYEQYLERHGHGHGHGHGRGHVRDYNGFHQGAGQLGYNNNGSMYGGWMGCGPGAGYTPEDAYAKYVASWYRHAPNTNGQAMDVGYGYGAPDPGWHGHHEDFGPTAFKRH